MLNTTFVLNQTPIIYHRKNFGEMIFMSSRSELRRLPIRSA